MCVLGGSSLGQKFSHQSTVASICKVLQTEKVAAELEEERRVSAENQDWLRGLQYPGAKDFLSAIEFTQGAASKEEVAGKARSRSASSGKQVPNTEPACRTA